MMSTRPLSAGEGLYLLSTVAESTGSDQGEERIRYAALRTISSNFAESIIDSAMDSAHGSDQYSAAFVGELMYHVYETRISERQREAVTMIESWYLHYLQRKRSQLAWEIVSDASQRCMAEMSDAAEKEAATGILHTWARRCLCARRAKVVFQERSQSHREGLLRLSTEAEQQEASWQHHAAVRIQTVARRHLARLHCAALLIQRERAYRTIVVREAAETVRDFLRANAARRIYQRHREEDRQRRFDELTRRSATTIQSFVRWQLSRRWSHHVYESSRVAAVTKITAWWRGRVCFWAHQRQKAIAEHERRLRRIDEAVVSLQAYVRMFLARTRYLRMRNAHRAIPLFQRVGRGFVSRLRKIAKNRNRELAARHIQRFFKLVKSKSLLNDRRKYDAERKKLAFREYAAQRIQRCWKMHAARSRCTQLRLLREKRLAAAVVLQRNGHMWAAQCKLRKLRRDFADEKFERFAHRAATLIQCNARGWMARNRSRDVQRTLYGAKSLILRVAKNFLFRKDLAMYHCHHKRSNAAIIIQHAYRSWVEIRRADRRYRMRIAYLRNTRRREQAAAMIQAIWRGHVGRQAYHALRRKRHQCAIKIQTQVRMMFARQILDALIFDYRRDLAARRIQMVWLSSADRFRQRRAVKEYELQIASFEMTALLRKQQTDRMEIERLHDDWAQREGYRYRVKMEQLAEDYAERLAKWQASAPVELQQEAATKIQAHIRGLLDRNRRNDTCTTHRQKAQLLDDAVSDDTLDDADDILQQFYSKRSGKNSTDKKTSSDSISMLAAGLQALTSAKQEWGTTSSTAPSESSDAPEEMGAVLSWANWLAEHREKDASIANHLRAFERLLQRESNARHSLIRESEVVGAMLYSNIQVLPNRRFRPIFALTNRSKASMSQEMSRTQHGGEQVDTPSSSTTTTPRPHVLLPPLLVPASHSSLLSRGIVSQSAATYAVSADEAFAQHTRAARDARLTKVFTRAATNDGYRPAVVTTPETCDEEEGDAHGACGAGNDPTKNSVEQQPLSNSSSTCDLRGLGLTEQQLRLVVDKLRSNSVFVTLLLDRNNLSDAVCSDIGDLMLRNSAITTFSLADNPITDVGITHLITAIARSPHVTSVALNGTLVTEAYRAHLSRLLARNVHHAQQKSLREADATTRSGGGASLFAGMRSLPPKLPVVAAPRRMPPPTATSSASAVSSKSTLYQLGEGGSTGTAHNTLVV